MYFDGQHAIITGGSSGIGKATAKLLAAQGSHISIIARDRAQLSAAQAEIEAARSHSQQRVAALSADVADKEQVDRAIAAAIAEIGTPDILICSAGIAHPGYFIDLPVEIFTETMDINYFGSLYSIKAVLPSMQSKRRGHILLISSGAGLIGIYGYTPYSPSKFAVRGLAEALRGELKPLGINISVVYPPDTDTPQLEQENLTKPPETKIITETAKTWSAEAVAQKIIDGIKKKQFAIAPGLEMSVLAKLHSLIAPQINRYCDRVVSQIARQG